MRIIVVHAYKGMANCSRMSVSFDLPSSARIPRAAFCRLVSVAIGVVAGSCKSCCALLFSAVMFNAAMVIL